MRGTDNTSLNQVNVQLQQNVAQLTEKAKKATLRPPFYAGPSARGLSLLLLHNNGHQQVTPIATIDMMAGRPLQFDG